MKTEVLYQGSLNAVDEGGGVCPAAREDFEATKGVVEEGGVAGFGAMFYQVAELGAEAVYMPIVEVLGAFVGAVDGHGVEVGTEMGEGGLLKKGVEVGEEGTRLPCKGGVAACDNVVESGGNAGRCLGGGEVKEGDVVAGHGGCCSHKATCKSSAYDQDIFCTGV